MAEELNWHYDWPKDKQGNVIAIDDAWLKPWRDQMRLARNRLKRAVARDKAAKAPKGTDSDGV